MTNRKKRLQKGIDSLSEQIEIHEGKKRIAHDEGKFELEGYYEKEIQSLKENKSRKQEKLDR